MSYPKELKQLCAEIERLSNSYSMMIIPGGGHFADQIRKIDRGYHFKPSTSHKMAILAMDQYGLYLSELLPTAKKVQSLSAAKKAGYAILLPSQLLFKVSEKELPHSWDVTSDSIACYIAAKLKAEKLILIKTVDGILDKGRLQRKLNARELVDKKRETCVDKTLPELLIKYKINCCILNGRYPERLRGALDGKQVICTRINN